MNTCGKCRYIYKHAVYRTDFVCLFEWKPITRSSTACDDYSKRTNMRKIPIYRGSLP